VLGVNLQQIQKDYDSLREKILTSELDIAESNLFNKTNKHMAALASTHTTFGITYNYGGCTCALLYCICCARIQISESEMNTTSACVNLRYNNTEAIMSSEFNIEGFSKSLPESFNISKKELKFCYQSVSDELNCLIFYGVANTYDDQFVKGCIELEVKKSSNVLATIGIGCFSMLKEVGHSYFLKDIVSTHMNNRSTYISRHNPYVIAPILFF